VDDNAEKSTQNEISNPIRQFGIDQYFKAGQILGMMRGVFPMGIDESVDVKKYHAHRP